MRLTMMYRGGSRTAATSKMEHFVIIVNYYHKVLHLGCCSSPRSASDVNLSTNSSITITKKGWRKTQHAHQFLF